jgi:major membrane immunogen (membrane-anchored lipoprotein)
MKKLLGLVLIIVTFSLTACTVSHSIAIKSVETNTATSIKMSYEKFTGIKTKIFTLDNGDPMEMNVDIKTDSGKLNLSVKGKDGESFYSGTELPTSAFQVILGGAGKYEITIQCDDHKGGYEITWGKH